jgi:hypothetical protein
MSGNDPVLDRLKAADPAPEIARIDPDEISAILSLLEKRREAMTTQTPVRLPEERADRQARRVPALAFGIALVAVVLAIGTGILIFMGGSGEDVIAPGTTTTPSPTIPPATATTAQPEAEAPALVPPPFETSISQPLEQMATMTGSDGHPLFVGWVETDLEPGLGSIRLVRCTDPGCIEDPEVVDVVNGIEWQGSIALTEGPAGHPVIGYRSGYDAGATTFEAYSTEELPGREVHTILYCGDDRCSEFESSELEPPAAFEAMLVGGMAFTEIGNPVFTYVLGPPGQTTLHLVQCHDPGCQVTTDSEIDAAPFLRGSRFVHGAPLIMTEGEEVLLAYSASTPTGPPGPAGGWDDVPMVSEVRVAYCADADCSTGAVVTKLGDGILPLPMVRSDQVTHVKFAAVEGDGDLFAGPLTLTDARCADNACSSFTLSSSTPLPGTPGVWEDWTYDAEGRLAWALVEELREPGMVEGESGPVPGEVGVGTRLAYSRCDDIQCSAITTIELGSITDADYWAEASVLVTTTGEPLVVLNEETGIRILRPLAN